MEKFSFENLTAYQEARKLVTLVYKLVANFPNEEKYALSAQIRRAIVSVPSNLAEGCGRISYKEKIHFAEIAYGSLMETFCQLHIALDLGYISETDIANIKPQFFSVSRLINALSKSYAAKLNP